MEIPKHISTFWNEFLKSKSCPKNANDLFEASYRIGLSEDDANEGARLILSGEKTATSSLLWKLEETNSPMPQVGNLCVVENGSGDAMCVVKTTWVKVISFSDVDESFAHDYSETDGTLEDWYNVFGEYYSQECIAMGKILTKDTPLLCERFEVIYS